MTSSVDNLLPFKHQLQDDERFRLKNGKFVVENVSVRKSYSAWTRFWTRGEYSQSTILKKMGTLSKKALKEQQNDKQNHLNNTFITNYKNLIVRAVQQNTKYENTNFLIRFFKAKTPIDVSQAFLKLSSNLEMKKKAEAKTEPKKPAEPELSEPEIKIPEVVGEAFIVDIPIPEDTIELEFSEVILEEEVSEDILKEEITEDTIELEISEVAVEEEISEDILREEMTEETIKLEISEVILEEEVTELILKEEMTEEISNFSQEEIRLAEEKNNPWWDPDHEDLVYEPDETIYDAPSFPVATADTVLSPLGKRIKRDDTGIEKGNRAENLNIILERLDLVKVQSYQAKELYGVAHIQQYLKSNKESCINALSGCLITPEGVNLIEDIPAEEAK